MRRDAVFPDDGAAGGGFAFDLDQILDHDRQAMKRSFGVSGTEGAGRLFGLLPGLVFIQGNEGMEPRLPCADVVKTGVHDVDRRKAPRGDAGGKASQPKFSKIGHGPSTDAPTTLIAPPAPG